MAALSDLPSILEHVNNPWAFGALAILICYLIMKPILASHIQNRDVAIKVLNFTALIGVSVCVVIIIGTSVKTTSSKTKNYTFTEAPPIIIGIYPRNLFGPYQQEGLHYGVKTFCDGEDVAVYNINNGTIKEFKEGNIQQDEEALRTLLSSNNVLAISGPSITEFTPNVIAKNVELSKSVMFVSSAAPKDFLDWDTHRKNDLPLFRISSGIDLRGQQLANFLRAASAENKKIGFLIEKGVNGKASFGEVFLEQIKKPYKDDYYRLVLSGNITSEFFERGHNWSEDERYHGLFENSDIVFYLGVGNDYEEIVKAHYSVNSGSSLTSRPILVSWMHAHSLEPLFDNGDYHFDDIVEITDLYIPSGDIGDVSRDIFNYRFNRVGPSMRDQAFSYDAALTICHAYKQLKDSIDIPANQYIKFDQVANQALKDVIDNIQLQGASGYLGFLRNGENPQTKMTYLGFNKNVGWQELRPLSILSESAGIIESHNIKSSASLIAAEEQNIDQQNIEYTNLTQDKSKELFPEEDD